MSADEHAARASGPGDGPTSRRRRARKPNIDSAGFGSWQWSVASNVVTFSDCAEALHGLKPGTFGGTLAAFGELIHPEDRDRAIAAFFSAFSSGGDRFVEYRTQAAAGASQWIFTWVNAVQSDQRTPAGLTGICLGGDRPHDADLLFERAQTQFSVVLDGVTDGITVQTPAGDPIYGNAAAHRILGITSVAEFGALSERERRERFAIRDERGALIPGDDFPTTRALRGEQPDEMVLILQPLNGGDRRWVSLKSTPITDDQGQVRFVVNRLRDISGERRHAEELRESEERYRLLFESNPIPMWVFDLESLRFLAVNDAAIHQYGWPREEFLNLTLLDVRPAADHPAILRKLARIAAEPEGLDVAGVWRHRRRDGSLIDVDVTTHALTFAGRDARFSIAINVTERTRHERRLERLSALTAALAAALVPSEVARVINRYAIGAGADIAAVAAYDPAAQMVAVLHRQGYPEHIPEQSEPFPVADSTMFAQVIRTGQAVIAPSWDEFDRMHPELAPSRRFAGEAGEGAGLILPLLADERPIGAIKLAFREPQVFPQSLLDELQTIAYLCAQALVRAQLYAAEQAARAQAEIGERVARREAARTAIMAELSRTLAEAGLDVQAVLSAVARTTAEHTGDACAIALFGEPVEEQAVDAIHHVDPAIRDALARLVATEWREQLAFAAAHIATTGEPVLVPVVDSPAESTPPPGASIGDPATAITVHSLLILPFRAHGRITGAMALLRMVPDRPYSAEDLAFFQELSDRAALALDNARLYHETQAAVRARDEFLSAAAHELRTPVTTVKGYAQMLLRAQVRAGLATDRATDFLQAIDESTDRLRLLTDDLLDVSRLRLGQMPLHPQPLDLVEVTSRMLHRFQARLDSRHRLTLTAETPTAIVSADPTRIEQVLSNLLENATKYSPAGGEIVVTLAEADDGVRISVRDPGIGLPAADVERIFEPFNRAENAIRASLPGLGLGLYICHSIVARHGGRIEAESAGEGHGSTFHLWLPAGGIVDAHGAG